MIHTFGVMIKHFKGLTLIIIAVHSKTAVVVNFKKLIIIININIIHHLSLRKNHFFIFRHDNE